MGKLTPTTQHQPQELQSLYLLWRGSVEFWFAEKISAPELVARLLLLERRAFCSGRCLGARRSESTLNPNGLEKAMGHIDSVIGLNQLTQILSRPEISALALLSDWLLMGLSDKINEVLEFWSTGQWPLQICATEIEPKNLLSLQAQGLRAVTVITDENLFLNYRHGFHDSVGFVLHDLMHAQKYYRAKDSQMTISKFYLQICDLVTAHLPPSLQERWHYLIADMNTHVLHSLKTFKSLLFDWYDLAAPGLIFSEWLQGLAFHQSLSPPQSEVLAIANTPAEKLASESSLLQMLAVNALKT